MTAHVRRADPAAPDPADRRPGTRHSPPWS